MPRTMSFGLGLDKRSLRSNWTAPLTDLIQQLSGAVESDGFTLKDLSAEGNDALLVNSNCLKGSNTALNINSLNTTPVASGLSCYDFSVEFSFKTSTITGTKVILGRFSDAGGTSGFLSCFTMAASGLKYYHADGSSSSNTTIIALLTANQEYKIKATVSNSTGRIDWFVDGVAGAGANITNKTPATALANEMFAIGRGYASSSALVSESIWDVKYYDSVNYADLTHHWPLCEGNGLGFYDIIGTLHGTMQGASWGTQNKYHYNYINGFELYGNSTGLVIRVPYKAAKAKITPTISGYTKYSDCDAGAFHNFAETGIKRNPLNDATLAASGVADTNVIYYGSLDGNDGYSFVKNWMELENNWCVYSSSSDRKSKFSMPLATSYFTAGSTRVILGLSGKVHSTNLKAGVSVASRDYYVRNGTYTLNSATLIPILLPNGANIIGQSKAGVIINGSLPYDAGNLVSNDTSTFDVENITALGYSINNLSATARNMRYVLHDDFPTQDLTRNLKNVDFEHFGSVDAIAYDALTVKYQAACGTGWRSGSVTNTTGSRFKGFGTDAGFQFGYGFGAHGNEVQTNPANWEFINTDFEADANYPCFAIRFEPSTTQQDTFKFNGCTFNTHVLLDSIQIYHPIADKVQMYCKTGDQEPSFQFMNQAGLPLIGLQFEANADGVSIASVAGVTTTLLMGSVIVDELSAKYHIRGTKNVTDSAVITGHVHLGADMLQDCSSVNKTMQIVVDGTTYTITFDANYTAMTNAQVVAAINVKLAALSCPATCKLYDYLTNAKWRYY